MISDAVGTGDNGRDKSGKFAAGNGFAKGNPNHRKVARLRAALLAAVDEQKLQEAAVAILTKACGGDVIAFRELCDRVLGKPSPTDLLDRLERLEALVEEHGHGR